MPRSPAGSNTIPQKQSEVQRIYEKQKHNFFLATRFDIEWDLTEPEALYDFITTECK